MYPRVGALGALVKPTFPRVYKIQTLCMKSPQDRIKRLKPLDRETQDCFLIGILQTQPPCATRPASPCIRTTYGWVTIRTGSGKKPHGTYITLLKIQSSCETT